MSPDSESHGRAYPPSFLDFLRRHVGEKLTVVTPEHFEDSGHGHQLRPAFYEATLKAVHDDYVVLFLYHSHGTGTHATKEPAEQCVPISRLKRVTLMRSERILHL
jgi:hypothetical protein